MYHIRSADRSHLERKLSRLPFSILDRWFNSIRARISRLARYANWGEAVTATSFEIAGACKMSGNCCRNLILVDRGRPIRNLRTWRRAQRRDPEYEMFIPNEGSSSDGLMRFHCRNQASDNRCLIYHERPEMCRSYPEPEMFARGGDLLPGCGYRLVTLSHKGKRFETALKGELARDQQGLVKP